MIKEQIAMLEMDLRCDPAAPAAVRASMSSLPGLGWALGDAMLVASELVTSVLRYTGCNHDHWIQVHVGKQAGAISISVEDQAFSVQTRPRTPPRGLEIDELGLIVVDRLTQRWGTERDQGYRVWAEVPLNAVL